MFAQKKSGAGGKSAPLRKENLQGESMSVIWEQFEDRVWFVAGRFEQQQKMVWPFAHAGGVAGN
jgi:hypothetical protein